MSTATLTEELASMTTNPRAEASSHLQSDWAGIRLQFTKMGTSKIGYILAETAKPSTNPARPNRRAKTHATAIAVRSAGNMSYRITNRGPMAKHNPKALFDTSSNETCECPRCRVRHATNTVTNIMHAIHNPKLRR